MGYLENRKFKKSVVKGALISTIASGIISGVLSSNISRRIGINTGEKMGYERGYEEGFKEGVIEGKNDAIFSNSVSSEEEKNVVDYILTIYNAKGNDLTRDNLGLVRMNPMFLFQNEIDEFVMDPMNKDRRVYKKIKDSDKNEVYIYIDNNTSKPVAGITNIYDKSVNVYVNSYSAIDGSNENISLDNGDYVNLKLPEEELDKFYEQTLDYFEERMRKANNK